MTARTYEVRWSKTARKAIAERLPEGIAVAAVELITGPLAASPRRVGKALRDELAGIFSARLAREWRVRYEIGDDDRIVTILDIRRRADAYRGR